MPKRILVIDDESAILRGFVLAFKGFSYQLDTAVSGKEGLAKAGKEKFDLIFLDLAMPDMNGLDVLRGIRREHDKLPVYIITGYYREFSELLKAAEVEGLEFELIQKPFGPEKILAIAQSVLEGPQKISAGGSTFVFKLFVAGMTQKAENMALTLNRILAQRIQDRFLIETIDILANPEAAESYNVFATPTLLKLEPVPVRSIVGDLRDSEKVCRWMTSIGC